MNDIILLDRAQLKKQIHAALKSWSTPAEDGATSLTHLLLWHRRRDDSTTGDSFVSKRLLINHLLESALEELQRRHEASAHLLRWRFLEGETQQQVANRLHISPDTLSRRQRAALNSLTDIVYEQEMSLRRAEIARLEGALPLSTYRRLIGLDDARERLTRSLTADDGPAIAAIAGLGGIGKTALADAILRALIRQFYFNEIIWLDYEPESMSGHFRSVDQAEAWLLSHLAETIAPEDVPFSVDARRRMVQDAFRARRFLVVVDNLEDEDDTALLITAVQHLAGSSRFLITTRTRPSAEQTIFTHQLEELSAEDAYELLLEFGRELGLADLHLLRDEDFAAIFQAVGGHPLALKLVISSLDPQPLPHILDGLSGGRDGDIADMYDDIYQQTWRTLSPAARELLETMTMVGSQGADPEHLLIVSGLDEAIFWQALTELRSRSLLEVRGTPRARRYGIHRLTERFLEAKVARYREEE